MPSFAPEADFALYKNRLELKKMQKHLDRGDVMLRVNPEVVKQLKAPGTKWLQKIEEMIGKTILVKSDPSIHLEQFDIH